MEQRQIRHAVAARQELLDQADKEVAVGAIYTGLDRLEQKGYVESWMGEPTAKRGGRGKRIYRVTSAGRRALADMDRAFRQVSAGLRTEKGAALAVESTATPRSFTNSLLLWQPASAADSW